MITPAPESHNALSRKEMTTAAELIRQPQSINGHQWKHAHRPCVLHRPGAPHVKSYSFIHALTLENVPMQPDMSQPAPSQTINFLRADSVTAMDGLLQAVEGLHGGHGRVPR